MEDYRERGIERMLRHHRMTEGDLVFEGKIEMLGKDPRVGTIFPTTQDINKRAYQANLKERLQSEEILVMLTEHNFGGPEKIIPSINDFRIHEIMTVFYSDQERKYYITFLGPLPGEVWTEDCGYVDG